MFCLIYFHINSMIEVKNKVCIENVIISVSIHSCILWEVKIVKILLSLIQYQKIKFEMSPSKVLYKVRRMVEKT
jgi:hypothetical protein